MELRFAGSALDKELGLGIEGLEDLNKLIPRQGIEHLRLPALMIGGDDSVPENPGPRYDGTTPGFTYGA